ncbi:hypothetical protein BGL67_00580 [Helicobacter pylori]|uniref:hypothetical protein n=1 Tax=Helicobacter pylori TaxID=210 RepID=UPI0009A469D3|nr:hypothetical protein [Helicobacter pylori]MCQ2703352.1 hypothetical protein [Helicobacter pylori]OPG37524.1 hypothetical protein BGL67_00580 [Helicobacter pylori]
MLLLQALKRSLISSVSIEDLKHAHYLSQVKEREEYYKNHVEEALKKDSECFEKGGDKVDCSAAMRIAAGERNRRMLEIK